LTTRSTLRSLRRAELRADTEAELRVHVAPTSRPRSCIAPTVLSPRKPNMLEAFQASDEQPIPPPPRPTPAPRRSREPRAPKPPRRAPAEVFAGGPAWSERAPVFLVGTLALLGLLAGAYWLGRLSVGRVPAGETLAAGGAADARWDFPGGEPGPDDAPARAAERAPVAEEAADEPVRASDELDAEGRTADDRSFYDKANRFTVRAIYYGNTPKGWKRALAAYRYLRAQGLPAIAPIDQGEILVLCVGAEPRREGRLDQLSERLRELPGPPPQGEAGAFAGAYFVNIDDLVERP
jgi:hypothetical protein